MKLSFQYFLDTWELESLKKTNSKSVGIIVIQFNFNRIMLIQP